jgi:hypothetical protein
MVEIKDPFVREKLQEIQEARDKAKTLAEHTREYSKPRFGAMFFVPLCFTIPLVKKAFYRKSLLLILGSATMRKKEAIYQKSYIT